MDDLWCPFCGSEDVQHVSIAVGLFKCHADDCGKYFEEEDTLEGPEPSDRFEAQWE